MPESGNVIGYIDGVADGDVFGWALDKSAPGEPVLLTVYADGHPMMQILTVEYRPDIATTFGNEGLNGFRIKIPTEFVSDTPVEISVVSEAGDHLIHSPFRVGGDLLMAPPELNHDDHESCLLFMHIQKTSGTAFREAIIANYRRSELLFVYPSAPGVWHEAFHKIPYAQRNGFRCVTGHFVFGIHKKIEAPSTYVTVLRDPVARVVSNYYHLMRNQSLEVRSFQGDVLSLQEVLAKQATAELDNLIVRCFSGNGARQCPPGMVGLDAYKLAVENLKYFRFVGHREASEDAWQSLRQMFGWRKGELRKANVGQAVDYDLSRQTRLAIEHYCRYDIMFYEYVLTRWPHK